MVPLCRETFFTLKTALILVVFYLNKEIKVKKGEVLKGNIAAIKDKGNYRFIDVKIGFHFENNKGDWCQLYKIT